MKLFNLSLFILSLAVEASTPVLAADPPQEANPYQSTFDGYKPISDENLSDWKSINVPTNGGGHAGHSMSGMQHKMSPEQKAIMSSESKEMPDMAGIDHSNMQGMDHKKMTDVSHENMAHEHGGSDMKAMNHSEMSDSKRDQTHPSDKEAAQDESRPHEHASEQDGHAGMEMPSKAASSVPTTPWLIVPNFHPIAVHFPIALTVIAFILSIAAYARRSHPVSAQLAAAGHFTLWLAAIGAAVAVLFGWLAYNSVNHDDAGHAAMLLHRSWAIPTAIGLIFLASWDAWKYRVNELISVPMLFLLFVLSQAIAVTGWLGGEVVYRHGIGVLSLPSSEISGHGQHHEHGGKDAAEHARGMSEDKADKNANERTELPVDEKGESHEH